MPKTKLTKLSKTVKKQSIKYIKKQSNKQTLNITEPTNPPHSLKTPKCPYKNTDKILLIGEGNFSFSSSLSIKLGSSSNILATSLDTDSIVLEKYPDSNDHITLFKEYGGTVLHSIDATKLLSYKLLKKMKFDFIVFHFPHCGAGIKNVNRNTLINQQMILLFLKNAKEVLIDKDGKQGEIHITLKCGLPYDDWNIRKLAKSVGLVSKETFRFYPDLYNGYTHRRTLGYKLGVSLDDNEEINKKVCKTYCFVKWNDVKVKSKGNTSDEDEDD